MRRTVVIVTGAAALLVAAGAGLSSGGSGIDEQAEPPAAGGQPVDKMAEEMFRMNQPVDGHKLLAERCGTFDVKVTAWHMPGADPMVISGTVVRDMILGGKFMRDLYEWEIMGQKSTSLSIYGYNPDAQGGPRFEITRYSSMMACTMPETGTYDAGTKTLTSSGEHDANGMRGRIRVVHQITGEDTETAEVHLAFDGYSEQMRDVKVPEYKAMVMEYTRRK